MSFNENSSLSSAFLLPRYSAIVLQSSGGDEQAHLGVAAWMNTKCL